MRNLGFSGDEPHYLVITQSLVYDHDINVKNQYLREAWREFYREKWVRIFPHARPTGKNTWYSIHLPGTSALLVPFYLIARPLSPSAKKFIIRMGFSLYGLAVLYLLFLFLREEFGERISLYSTSLIAFTVPAFPFFFHLFPEVPVAGMVILSLYSFYKGRPGLLIFSGFLAGFLPWFGAKYVIYLFMLFIISLFTLKKKGVYFLLPALLPSASFFLFLKHAYGSFSLLSVYYGPLPPEKRAEVMKDILYRIPWHYRFSTFLDYLFDQRDGLLPYAPVYLFSMAALLRFWKRKISLVSLALFLPFVFNYGWQTHRGGYCPPARPLASGLWAFAVGFALFLEGVKNKNLRWLFRALSGLSIGLGFLLASMPLSYYGPTTHDVANRVGLLFHKISTPLLYLPRYLPSFTKNPKAMPGNWLPNYFWVPGVFLALALLIYLMKREGRERSIVLSLAFVLALLPFLALPQIPLAKGRVFAGKMGKVKVYNWKEVSEGCVKGGKRDPLVFITRSPIRAEGRGKLLIGGRVRVRIREQALISPALGFRFVGGRLLAIKLLDGEVRFCP